MFWILFNMRVSKFTLILLMINIEYIEPVTIQCLTSSLQSNGTDLCYYYKSNSLSWVDAYNQCLSETIDGVLMQISSVLEFNLLKNISFDKSSRFWLGANNFAIFHDPNWRWLDGSIVNDKIITWCSDSTYQTNVGTYCAAYDSVRNCVNNYPCSIHLPAPCISAVNKVSQRSDIALESRAATTSACSSAYSSGYANWWTYSVLLLNWFILFSFYLYLCNRFALKRLIKIITSILTALSNLMIIVFTTLWSLQYRNITTIPLVTAIMGSLAGLLLLIVLIIILNNRNYVSRLMITRIVLISTFIIEMCFMIGLILCIAYCSSYVTLTETSLEKDIIASILTCAVAIMSVLSTAIILHLLENKTNERIYVTRTTNPDPIPSTITQSVIHPRQSNTTAPDKSAMERSTSPVDERVLNEYYTCEPSFVHQYTLDGRKYVIYEGNRLSDIDRHRKELTQAMLLQESEGLRDAINRAKNSIHASNLNDEIHQAQGMARKLI